MSITTLIVAVRTSGAAGLARLGAGFTALHGRAQAASRSITTAFGPRLRTTMNRAQRAMQDFGRVVGEVGGEVLSSFARLGPLIAGVAGLILAAIPAIIDLSGLITLLPPAILAAAASLVVLKMAFKGVGGAISAGLKGDWNKWEKAHKNFPRSAHDFAAAVVIVANSWKKLQRAVQENFFHGLGATLRQLNASYMPTLSKWLVNISGDFGTMLRRFGEWLHQPAQVAQVEGIFRNLSEVIHGLLRTLQPLTQIFLDIASVAAPRLASMTGNFADSMDRLAAKIRELRDNGKLGEWVDKARVQFAVLRDIIRDLGGIIGAFYTGAAAEGKPFLEQVRDQTRAMNEFFHSQDGQDLIGALTAIGTAIIALGSVIAGLTAFFKQAFLGMYMIAVDVMAGILHAAANAFGWIPGIGPKLRQASAEFDAFAVQVNQSVANIDQDREVNFTYLVHARIDPAAAPYAGINQLNTTKHVSGIQFRARGGPVVRGRPYVVGENGPEFFVPSSGGRVLPNGGGGTGGGGAMSTSPGTGRYTGLEAMFKKWLDDGLFSGKLKYQVTNGRLQPV